MRDSQRQRVYDWEERIGHITSDYRPPNLEMDEAREFVRKVWWRMAPKSQRGRPPFLQDGRGVRRGHGSRTYINIPKRFRNRWFILHEIAHGLVPRNYAGHGPEFVRVLISCLTKFDGWDEKFLLQSAKEHRLKVIPWATLKRQEGIRI